MARITCTPAVLMDTYKCLKCLSDSELLALFVIILADQEGTYTLPDDLDLLLKDAACFTCLGDRQLLQAGIAAMANDIEADATVPELREKIKCLLCAPPRVIKGLLAYITCLQFNDAEQ